MDDVAQEHLSDLLRVIHQCNGAAIAFKAGDLNLLHWNINHLTNKLHEVDLSIASYPSILHVIAISETWLTTSNSYIFRLNGYREIHSVRVDKEGGGLTIFAHEYNLRY